MIDPTPLFRTTAELIYDTDMQHGDGRDYWPFHPVFLDSIVAPYVFDEIYLLVNELLYGGHSFEEVCKLFYSPTKIANYQYLWAVETVSSLSKEKKRFLAEFFTDALTFFEE